MVEQQVREKEVTAERQSLVTIIKKSEEGLMGREIARKESVEENGEYLATKEALRSERYEE